MYSRLCSASFQSFPPAFRFGPDQFLTRVVPLITNEHRCNKPSEIRHERGGGGGEPGAESPHDAQRTNGAADSGHMSINPLRPLNASLPFHYSTPFRRPRSPPPPTLSLPICIVAHLDAGHSSRGRGGGASPPCAPHAPPSPTPSPLCVLLLQVPSRCRLDEQLRASWPRPAALYPPHSIKMWLGN